MSDLATNKVLFDAYKCRGEQLKNLVNLLADLIDIVESGNDSQHIIAEAKSYLLIETNLVLEFLDDGK